MWSFKRLFHGFSLLSFVFLLLFFSLYFSIIPGLHMFIFGFTCSPTLATLNLNLTNSKQFSPSFTKHRYICFVANPTFLHEDLYLAYKSNLSDVHKCIFLCSYLIKMPYGLHKYLQHKFCCLVNLYTQCIAQCIAQTHTELKKRFDCLSPNKLHTVFPLISAEPQISAFLK